MKVCVQDSDREGFAFLKRRWGGGGESSVPNLSVAVEDKGTRSAFTVKKNHCRVCEGH